MENTSHRFDLLNDRGLEKAQARRRNQPVVLWAGEAEDDYENMVERAHFV